MMKTVAALATVGAVSAFVAPNALPKVAGSSTSLRMIVDKELQSQAMPFLERNPVLDSVSLAADAGFDPLNLAKDEKTLLFYRTAEQKHGRLAMLAALGWVVAELFDGRLAAATGNPDLLIRPDADGIGLAPSLLNGGLATVPASYWLLVVGLTSVLEVKSAELTPQAIAAGKEPGDYGFDPFGLWPEDEEEQKLARAREVKNGRLAMVAIVAFAFQEAVSKVPVVEEVPVLFGLTPEEKAAEAALAADIVGAEKAIVAAEKVLETDAGIVERVVEGAIKADFDYLGYFLHRLHIL